MNRNNHITLNDVGYKPFFHLMDPVTLEAMKKGMNIHMCKDRYKNEHSVVEVKKRYYHGKGKYDEYPHHDSYCRVVMRGWQYGKGSGKDYNGDAWSNNIPEFMEQSDKRRCPICEAIYKQVPLKSIIEKKSSIW